MTDCFLLLKYYLAIEFVANILNQNTMLHVTIVTLITNKGMMYNMPYMDWEIVFQAFGFKILRCYECGSIYLQHKNKINRIWGESCLKHNDRHSVHFK